MVRRVKWVSKSPSAAAAAHHQLLELAVFHDGLHRLACAPLHSKVLANGS